MTQCESYSKAMYNNAILVNNGEGRQSNVQQCYRREPDSLIARCPTTCNDGVSTIILTTTLD